MNRNDQDKFFVVLRDENRVSDVDHVTKEEAQTEMDYWNRILLKWPDGSKITIQERYRR